MPAKNYATTRYSELAEITTENVKNLQVAFTFSLGVNKGQEAAPLVVGATMYIVTPYPNILYALDLAKPGAPMKWKFEPKPEPASQGVACCDVVNRGAAFADGRIYFNTLDDHTLAVDAGNRAACLEHEGRQHQYRRDRHDGAARREGQGSGRQFGRRVRACAAGSRRSTPRTAISSGPPTAPALTRTC